MEPTMNKFTTLLASIAMVWGGGTASAEILAMMNYESKTPDQVKALKLTGAQERREGIAIIDVDPESATFGKWLVDIPLDPAGVAHLIFYDRTMTKAYLTSLASGVNQTEESVLNSCQPAGTGDFSEASRDS